MTLQRVLREQAVIQHVERVFQEQILFWLCQWKGSRQWKCVCMSRFGRKVSNSGTELSECGGADLNLCTMLEFYGLACSMSKEEG